MAQFSNPDRRQKGRLAADRHPPGGVVWTRHHLAVFLAGHELGPKVRQPFVPVCATLTRAVWARGSYRTYD